MSDRASIFQLHDKLKEVINPATEEKQDDIITELQTLTGALGVVVDTPEYFEDTNFVAGDSPATLDYNTALGRNSNCGYVINDGPGDFTVSFSTDGAVFGDDITVKNNEILRWNSQSVDSIRITHVADSAYRSAGI